MKHSADQSVNALVKDQVNFTRSATFNCDILPTLGNSDASKPLYHNHRRSIIHPYNPLYRYWQNFLVFLVIYTAWMSPFETCFISFRNTKLWRAFTLTDTIVDFFFLIDIILTFFVAYVDRKTHLLETKPSKIASKYLKSGFALDVLSTLPMQTFLMFINSKTSVVYSALNMLRLWRLWRVSDFFQRLERDIRFNYYWIRSLKLLVISLFNIHCAGCFFFLLAELYSQGQDVAKTWIGAVLPDFRQQSPWVCYTYSMYWAMTTTATIGYGDIHPVNTWEMAFDTVYMLFGLGLNAYLIGNMTNLVVHLTSTTRKFRDSANAISMFAQRNQLPKRLRDEMLDHVRMKQKSETLKHDEILDSLPHAIRSAVFQHLFLSTVDNAYLFKGTSDDFRMQLVAEMKAEYFPPGQDIVLENDAPNEFYIVVSGAVDIMATYSLQQQYVIRSANAGDIVGEIGALCFTPQPFTIRAKSISQLLRINTESFKKIVQSNAMDGKVVIHNLFQHMKALQNPHLSDFVKQIENNCHILEIAPAANHQSAASVNAINKFRVLPNSPLLDSAYNARPDSKSTKTINFEESLFGVIASSSPAKKAGNCSSSSLQLLQPSHTSSPKPRITIFQHHPACGKAQRKAKVIALPNSFEELMVIASQKLEIVAHKVLSSDGAEIDDISLIRDSDHLYIVEEQEFQDELEMVN